MKPVEWVGNSKDDLKAFPRDVTHEIGRVLTVAQAGGKHIKAKPLKGHRGAGVLEIVENYDGDTYRAVYTVRFAGVVYVLHAFQKKAKRRIATPQKELDLIAQRLKVAEEHYKRHHAAKR